MKYYNFKYLDSIFLIMLICFSYCSTISVKAMIQDGNVTNSESNNDRRVKHFQSLNYENYQNMCKIIKNINDKNHIVVRATELSKNDQKNPQKFDFLFFLNRNDHFMDLRVFADNINIFFSDLIHITFYCVNKSINNKTNITSSKDDKLDTGFQYVIQHGNVLEKKKIENLSVGYMYYLLKKFNLNKYLDKKTDEIRNKNQRMINQIQLFIKNIKKSRNSFLEFDKEIEYKDKPTLDQNHTNERNLHSTSNIQKNKNDFLIIDVKFSNRIIRLMWALFFASIAVVICFYFLKRSVEWV